MSGRGVSSYFIAENRVTIAMQTPLREIEDLLCEILFDKPKKLNSTSAVCCRGRNSPNACFQNATISSS